MAWRVVKKPYSERSKRAGQLWTVYYSPSGERHTTLTGAVNAGFNVDELHRERPTRTAQTSEPLRATGVCPRTIEQH